MKKVKFTQMKDGTKDDYLLLDKHEKKYIEGTADRIIKFMSGLNDTFCLLYTSPSPRDRLLSRMPSSA